MPEPSGRAPAQRPRPKPTDALARVLASVKDPKSREWLRRLLTGGERAAGAGCTEGR